MAKTIASPSEVLAHFKLDPDILKPIAAEIAADEVGEDLLELTEDEQQILYEEVAMIDLALEKLTERREQIKNIFRRLDYGTTAIPGEAQGKVTIGHNPVFNEARFTTEKPYDYAEVAKVIVKDRRGRDTIEEQVVYPNRPLYKITPDRPAIKRILGEEIAKGFYDEGTKKVTIK